MTQPLADDDMTELVDAQITRVDLVKSPANGRPFVLMKAADDGLTHPLVPADMVRDLLAKAQEAPDVTDPATTPDDVAKDAPPVEVDDLKPDAPAGTTAESLPGSPDWEQLDGDTAMSTVAVLGRVKAVLGWLADREAQEAATGDLDDAQNAWDIDSLAENIDCIISALAGFAAGEHIEAGMADELEAVGKSVSTIAAPLAVIEGLAPIAKAGRTLSAANESKIRTAVDSLSEVLNSLPAAPAADDVTKETAVPETPTAVETEPVDYLAKALAAAPRLTAAEFIAETVLNGARSVEVAKAAGDPQLAVFDADGKLIGTIDPAKLSPIATSPAAADKADEPADDTPADEQAAPDAPADPAAAPDEDAAVIPGTQTVQSPPDHDPAAVAKAAAHAALEEFLPTLAEEVRKNAELASVVEVLKEQVRKYGQQPDDRNSPVLNGAGQGSGDYVDLEKAVADAGTPSEKREALQKLAYAKVTARFTH